MLRLIVVFLALVVFATRSAIAGALAEIPFEITENHTFIEVMIDGERLSFVFDSGAGGTALNKSTAERMGIEATGRFPATGVGGTAYVSVAAGLSLTLGPLRLDNIIAGLVPLDHLEESLDRPLDGIIGRAVLDGHVVVLDYDRRSLDVYERDAFPRDEWGAPCPLDNNAGVAMVQGEVRLLDGDVIDGSFFVDTGAGLFIAFNTVFAEANGLMDRVGETYARTGRALTARPIEERVGRVAGIRLCGYELPSSEAGNTIPARVGLGTEGVQGLDGPAGIIGNEIFKRFNMALDLAGRKMYLTPNAEWDRPIRTDASGLFVVRADDDAARIALVFKESPAQQAGLLVGDRLVSLDGIAASTLTLAEIRERLRAAGETVRIEVERGGASRIIDLRLRSEARR